MPANTPITDAVFGRVMRLQGQDMARFWVIATMAVMLALAGLASLTEDRPAAAQPQVVTAAGSPSAPVPATVSEDALPSRRAYERRHQRMPTPDPIVREGAAAVATVDTVRTAFADKADAAERRTAETVAEIWQPRRRAASDEPQRRVRKSIRHKDSRLARHAGDRESFQRRHAANHRLPAAPRRKVPRRIASNELSAGPARGEGT